MTKFVALATSAFVFFAGNVASSHEHHAGSIEITHPWVRPAAAGQNSAIYLTITNRGAEADRVLSVISPAARKAELHETRDQNGVMTMRPVGSGLEIKPGETVEFKPGGYHIMLFDLAKPLEAGAALPFTVTLAKAGDLQLEAKAEKSASPHTH